MQSIKSDSQQMSYHYSREITINAFFLENIYTNTSWVCLVGDCAITFLFVYKSVHNYCSCVNAMNM